MPAPPPTYFPQFNSGMTTQLPYRVTQSFNTLFSDNPEARPYAFARRGSGLSQFPAGPLNKFDLNFSSLLDTELATLTTFYDSMQGMYGEFCFLDPAGNLIKNSEDFSQASWTGNQTSDISILNPTFGDPFGGTRATVLQSASGNSYMHPVILPRGYGSGIIMCVSVWALSASSGQTLFIGFSNNSTIVGGQTYTLPDGAWTRIYFAMSIPNNTAPLCAIIGGNSTWNSTQIAFFGPQCCPTRGPGAYAKTPENYGYHPACRFDTDELVFTKAGPNQNQGVVPIQEYRNDSAT